MAYETAIRVGEMFTIGVLTPLTAACVIPMYPAFIAYLANTGDDESAPSVAVLGLLVVAGVITFMALAGIVLEVILQVSIRQGAVETFSPIAFGILAVIGFVMVVEPKGFSRVPTVEPPHSNYPTASAFGYGFFFGAIVVPCNPGFIGLFFARQSVLFDTTTGNLLGFLAFGLGIGAPLLALAIASEPFGRRFTRTLAQYSSPINRAVGAILVAVSVYYIVFIFELVPLPV